MQEFQFPDERIRVTGAFDFDVSPDGVTPRRLPAWTRPQVPVFMEMMVTQPSGVRLEFETNASRIELSVLTTRIQMAAREPALMAALRASTCSVQMRLRPSF